MSKPGVAVWDASLLTTLIVRSIITTMRLQTIEAGRQGGRGRAGNLARLV